MKLSRSASRHFATVMIGAVLVTLCAFSLPGCDGDDTFGPCEHVVREPILNLVAARDAGDGAPLDSLVITDLRRDGGPAHEARHRIDSGNCPSISDGGVRVELRLSRGEAER